MARHYSRQHLEWAAFFTRQAGNLESIIADDKPTLFEDEQLEESQIHEGFVVYSIISSFSFLDAYVNEILDMFHRAISSDQNSTEHPESINVLRQLEQIGENPFENNRPTLQKYQLLLTFTGSEPYARGQGIFQEVDKVRKIRNYFIHYSPDWIDSSKMDDEHITHEIGSSLQGKFDLNPFREDPSPFFPDKCMSHGCSVWCFNTCQTFANDFTERLPLDHKSFYVEKDFDLGK